MSNELPFISVVIPAYNEEKHLPICLTALTKQSYSRNRYEIIVSDNNSTDNTAAIAKKFGAKVVTTKEQGYAYAVKKGISSTKGEIIACTDSDTQVGKQWLSDIAHVFSTQPTTVALTGSVESDFTPLILRNIIDSFYSMMLTFTFVIGNPNLGGYNMAFRKKSYETVGGINTSYGIGADTELGRRLRKTGSVAYIRHIQVRTSARRWKTNFFKTLWKYSQAYFYTHYLNRPVTEKLPIYR